MMEAVHLQHAQLLFAIKAAGRIKLGSIQQFDSGKQWCLNCVNEVDYTLQANGKHSACWDPAN